MSPYLFIFLGGPRYHILPLFSSFQPGFFVTIFSTSRLDSCSFTACNTGNPGVNQRHVPMSLLQKGADAHCVLLHRFFLWGVPTRNVRGPFWGDRAEQCKSGYNWRSRGFWTLHNWSFWVNKNLKNEKFIIPEVEELFLNPFEKWVFYGSNLVSLQFGIPKKVAFSSVFQAFLKTTSTLNRIFSWRIELKSLFISRKMSEMLLIFHVNSTKFYRFYSIFLLVRSIEW